MRGVCSESKSKAICSYEDRKQFYLGFFRLGVIQFLKVLILILVSRRQQIKQSSNQLHVVDLDEVIRREEETKRKNKKIKIETKEEKIAEKDEKLLPEKKNSTSIVLPCIDKLRDELSCAICLVIFEPSTITCGHR